MPRILVVDDEEDVCAALQSLLGLLEGCTVECARSYAEGAAKARAGGWDLILSDERLPDGRGMHILVEASRAGSAKALALMTAYPVLEVAQEALHLARVDAFFQKPWEPEDLLLRVQRMFEDGGARRGPRSGAPPHAPTPTGEGTTP